jgi:hypothetical protein
MLYPAQGRRAVTLSSDKEVMPDVPTHYAQEGVKGSHKWHKQCIQGTMNTTSSDNGYDKRPTRLPMDHFKMLLKEACSNHTYPVRHNLKDCSMMRGFMTSGTLT